MVGSGQGWDKEELLEGGLGNHGVGPGGRAGVLPEGPWKPTQEASEQQGLNRGAVPCSTSDARATCYKDQGISYRGTWSTAQSGTECVNWNSSVLALKPYSARRPGAIRLGLGNHNYCR